MNPRILVVDDDTLIRRIMRDTLETLPAAVAEAGRGEEAIRIAKAEKPDLIFLDTMMPGMDGFQVAEALKQDPATADIPLMFVSALGTASHKVRGLDLGAEDYLAKPIDPDELKARVRTILRRVRRAAPAPAEPAAMATVTTGQLHAMPLPALVRWLELEGRSARLALARGGEQGEILFAAGRIAEAGQGARRGEMAVYQLLTWQDGTFEILPIDAEPTGALGAANEALLREGERRMAEIPDLWASLPCGDAPLEIPAGLRVALQAELPALESSLVALLDASRMLDQVLGASPADAWTTLRVLHRLLRLGALGWTPASGAAGRGAARRTLPRVALTAPVQYLPLRQLSQADRFLLTARGMFIQTATPCDVGEKLLLRFRLPGYPHWITATGQVMWGNVEPQKGKPDEGGMGLQFVEVSGEQLEAIEAGLARAIAAGVREASTQA